MNKAQNPFTHTYGSAGNAYIDMDWSKKAIENFMFEKPSEYVYKIVGVRGSGKTVVLSDIIRHFKKKEMADEGWLVYDLSSARDPLHTLVSYLANENFSKKGMKSVSINASASVGLFGGSLSRTTSETDKYYDDEVELDKLLEKAIAKNKKILICIDDISKTKETIAFCSVYAKYVRVEKPVYFICSGLFLNLNAIGKVKNLTFFKRAASIEVKTLSDVSITIKYKKLLGIETEEARKLAKLTKGYAYAYQVLGSLYFEKKKNEKIDDLIDSFDEILFTQSYEKIWEELSDCEQQLLSIMLEYTDRADILAHMPNPTSYSEIRSSLIKNGIISVSKRGSVEFCLPHFEEYVKYYCQ